MKAHTLTLFHVATNVLASVPTEKHDVQDTVIDEDTMRADIYNAENGRLILSANLYPHNRAIKEILFPTCRFH
jgi:hypothetical protein